MEPTAPDCVVNADGVGKSKDGNPQSCYIVLEAIDNTLRVTFRRVPYDIERAAQAIESSASEHPRRVADTGV